MHLCSSFLAIPQLSSSWLYYLCAYPHQFLPLALFLLLLLSLEHLFSLGTSSFSDVLFPSHSLGWSASLSPPILLSLSSSWLSVSPFSCVLPFINSFEGLLEDFSAAQVSARILNSVEYTSTLLSFLSLSLHQYSTSQTLSCNHHLFQNLQNFQVWLSAVCQLFYVHVFPQTNTHYPSEHAVHIYFIPGALPPLVIHIHCGQKYLWRLNSYHDKHDGQHLEAGPYLTEGGQGSHIPFFSTDSRCFDTLGKQRAHPEKLWPLDRWLRFTPKINITLHSLLLFQTGSDGNSIWRK